MRPTSRMTGLRRPLPFILAVALLLIAATPAAADFRRLTGQIGRIHDVHRQRIPFFGLGRLVVRMLKPEGIHDVKLAIFEDQTRGRNIDLLSIINRTLDHDWRLMVKAYSRRSGEETVVLAREEGRLIRLMVVSREDGEIVVVETAMDLERFAEHLMDDDF